MSTPITPAARLPAPASTALRPTSPTDCVSTALGTRRTTAGGSHRRWPADKGERMPVVVVATILPLAEHRAAVIDAIKETIGQVHAEDGAPGPGTDPVIVGRLASNACWSSGSS